MPKRTLFRRAARLGLGLSFALAVVIAVAMPAPVHAGAVQFATFTSQATGNNSNSFVWTNGGLGGSSISGSDQVTFTFSGAGGTDTTPQTHAVATYAGTGSGIAILGPGNTYTQGITGGTITFTDPTGSSDTYAGQTLLTVSFTSGAIQGTLGSPNATLVADGPVTYTSAIGTLASVFAPVNYFSIALTSTDASGTPTNITLDPNRLISSFTQNNTAGNAGEFTTSAVPAPTSVVMFGMGMIGVSGVAVRRKWQAKKAAVPVPA